MNTARATPLALTALCIALAVSTGLGAAAGSWLAARPAERAGERATAVPGPMAAAYPAEHPAFEGAVAALALEVRRLREELERTSSSRRVAAESAPGAEGTASAATAVDGDALVAALERIAQNLAAASERLAGPGTAGVRMTTEPMRVDLLRSLREKDYTEVNLEHIFWSVPRILDTYGRPTRAQGNYLEYQFGDGSGNSVGFRLGPTGFVQSVDM